jgi:sulfatase modifying factor 1
LKRSDCNLILLFSFINILSLAAQESNVHTFDIFSNTYNDEIEFIRVPASGITFMPVGLNDEVTIIDIPDYYLANSELIYEDWFIVHQWATAVERENKRYYFENAGNEGNAKESGTDPIVGSNIPVTWISWRDAILWCNALTEYYNDLHNINLSPAYTFESKVIRDVGMDNLTVFLGEPFNPQSSGFRLPTKEEWELAARWCETSVNVVPGYANPYFTTGKTFSGSSILSLEEDEMAKSVWFPGNSGFRVQEVRSLKPNDLGFYDMSGNVYEWTQSREGLYLVVKGGSVASYESLEIGKSFSWGVNRSHRDLGMRVLLPISDQISELEIKN